MKSKWAIAAVIIVTIGVIVTVALMMNRDSKPAQYTVEEDQLVITCSFGVSVPFDEVKGLILTQTAPDIKTKTNGASIGSVHKGEYLLTDGGSARLYIDTSLPIFICFSQGDMIYYLNAEDTESTQALYNQLSEALG